MYITTNSFCFPGFNVYPVNAAGDAPCTPNKEKEMSTGTNDFRSERSALHSALWAAHTAHEKKLIKHFHIEDERPVTPKALVEAIKEGKWTYIDEKTADDEGEWDGWMNPVRGLRFGPEPDKKGYKKAEEKFRQSFRDTETAISALTPDKGHEALVKFQKEVFTH
jgi:hypothetical protein